MKIRNAVKAKVERVGDIMAKKLAMAWGTLGIRILLKLEGSGKGKKG